MAKEKTIVAEIVERAEDFENTQANSLAEIQGHDDLYRVKPPKRSDNTFSNPRQTEFHRAANAVGTLSYRMLTASDPNFEARSMQHGVDFDQIYTIQQTWLTQLHWARYYENLLRACRFAPVFGTVICQEDYRVMGVSAYGRRVPTTVMMPRTLDQVYFDRATTNFHEAEWVTTADITSPSELMRLAKEAKDIKAPWNPKALEAASSAPEDKNAVNWRVIDRLRRYGFTIDQALKNKREILMFYGKLDCMNDGIEYVAAVINRKYLVRFHPNNFQHGRRPFRVAKWIDWSDSLGLGIGHILSRQHHAMDANRQRAQDLFSFGAYNMWGRKKNSVADEDLNMKPLGIVDMENQGDMWPLVPNLQAAEGILRLDEFLKQEFRAASLASDTLQAIASEGGTTATQASLSQNESIRAISVIAEHMAEPLVREHLESLHANNVQNIRAPFNINRAGIVRTVYPQDLRIDLDIRAKTTSDKDFTPKRLQDLQALLATLTSTKSQHPDQMQISVLPIVREMAVMLNVPPSEVILPSPQGMPAGMPMDAAGMLGLGQMTQPGMPGGDMPGPVSTPVGPTLAS